MLRLCKRQLCVLLGGTMDHFIHRENIAHYKRLLAEPHVMNDQVRHRELTRLLAAELAKDETPTIPK